MIVWIISIVAIIAVVAGIVYWYLNRNKETSKYLETYDTPTFFDNVDTDDEEDRASKTLCKEWGGTCPAGTTMNASNVACRNNEECIKNCCVRDQFTCENWNGACNPGETLEKTKIPCKSNGDCKSKCCTKPRSVLGCDTWKGACPPGQTHQFSNKTCKDMNDCVQKCCDTPVIKCEDWTGTCDANEVHVKSSKACKLGENCKEKCCAPKPLDTCMTWKGACPAPKQLEKSNRKCKDNEDCIATCCVAEQPITCKKWFQDKDATCKSNEVLVNRPDGVKCMKKDCPSVCCEAKNNYVPPPTVPPVIVGPVETVQTCGTFAASAGNPFQACAGTGRRLTADLNKTCVKGKNCRATCCTVPRDWGNNKYNISCPDWFIREANGNVQTACGHSLAVGNNYGSCNPSSDQQCRMRCCRIGAPGVTPPPFPGGTPNVGPGAGDNPVIMPSLP